MPDKFTFGSAGLIHELEMAKARAGGWSQALVKESCKGNVQADFRDVLLGRARIVKIKLCDFPIFCTICIGQYSSIGSLRREIESSGCSIIGRGNGNLDKIILTSTYNVLRLVKPSVGDLGFINGATTKEICVRAKKLGLDRCPAETGPQLRHQYKDQPRGECLFVATDVHKPIDSDDSFLVFGVERHIGGELWLGGYCGDPSIFWDAGNRFVFVSRQPLALEFLES